MHDLLSRKIASDVRGPRSDVGRALTLDVGRRTLEVIAVATSACFLVACAVGPKYRRPDVQTPPGYKELAGAANQQWKVANPSEGALRGNWWELFSDTRLNGLEQAVAISNQNVKQAEAQFREARALVAFNRANYYPTITTSPAITESYTSHNLGSRGFGGGLFTQYSLPLGVTWEPDLWGRVRLAVQNAAAAAQVSAADVENMRLSIQGDVAVDYFQMEDLDMQVRLLDQTITAYENALKLTVDRHSAGVASRTDVVQAQAQLDAALAQRTDLGIARAQFEHAIAVLAGQAPSTFSLERGQISGPAPAIPTGVPSQLLERRPDIAAAERQVAAANAQIGLARTAYYPTLTLGGSGGFQSSSITNLLTWPSRFWSVGPSLAFTIFDFGRRRAQVQQFEAAYDATVAAYRQIVLAAFQEVEDQLAALQLLAQEASEQDAAVTAAREALQLEIDRYKAGTASYLDVITSQTIAYTDERAAVQILGSRLSAAINLIRALGGGWNASSLPTPSQLKSKS